jgi:peptidoglycan/LPS O-acetylase OafA/YrhL
MVIHCGVNHQGNFRFDVARGISALVVFASHLTQVFVWPFLVAASWVDVLSGIAAREAVLLFFLPSGLLITKSIMANVERYGYFRATRLCT